MLSVFQLFKIIFGIVFSAFVLITIMRFSFSYTDIGESSQQAAVLIGFRKVINDVYTTGIPGDYSINNVNDVIMRYRPPDIISAITPLSIEPMTVLMVPGEDMGVYRNEYDLGWYSFYYMEVLPKMNVLINPLNATESVWDTAKNVVSAFPSTENIYTKVKFGFGCRNSYPFNDENWERERFEDSILAWAEVSGEYNNLSVCPLDTPAMDYFDDRITISPAFTVVDGILVVPMDGDTGYIYPDTSDPMLKYFYKNPIDVVSFFLGGDEFYNYTNKKFLNELKFAATLKINEINVLRPNMGTDCVGHYQELEGMLNAIKTLAAQDYRNQASMLSLNEMIKESVSKYKEIGDEGCD
ncbi:MAG: hypothetical protein JW754_05720 [Candidatus Aenigmarchaeota archaeon]|nr:hypothetical protein [Candidatus Aenigmarchaeota archaeon]